MSLGHCSAEGYLRFDTREFFEETARLAVDLAEGTGESNVKLLWLLIFSHNLLQSAMVNVLRGSANVGALDKKSQKEHIRWLNETRNGQDSAEPPSKSRLADFKSLLMRVQDGQWICPPLQLDQQQRKELDSLNKYRNEFIHFIDCSWSLPVDDLREPILVALKATGEILQHPDSKRWTWDGRFQERVSGYLTKIRNYLKGLDGFRPTRVVD